MAWFTHRTKTGAGHNWVGTSGGAEADMLEEVLTNVKELDLWYKNLSQTKIRPQMPYIVSISPKGQ